MRRTTLLFAAPFFLSVAGCDSTVGPEADGPVVNPAFNAHGAGAWHLATSVDLGGVSQLNTIALEGCPNESPDGRSLFFASDRDGGLDIWVSHRDAQGEWGAPEKLPPPVNTGAAEFCPTALPGGGLLFVSTRATDNCGTGTADIYETRLHPALGWLEPQHLGCTVNSSGNEFSPSHVGAGGGMLFFSSDRAGQHALYVSHRGPGGAWGVPAPVHELNLTGYNTVRPNVSQDGREIVFDSDRPGGLGGFDVWVARRATPHASWSAPWNPGAVINSTFNETRASLSRDGRRLYFGSNRPGFQGNSDLFVSRR
ncbi:MAG TPA: hypothetical protein VK922_01165 [Gemmatimonadaceae bacterium]|nr:hypothetical protein [Gemmatimonadaceae bacterium]